MRDERKIKDDFYTGLQLGVEGGVVHLDGNTGEAGFGGELKFYFGLG